MQNKIKIGTWRSTMIPKSKITYHLIQPRAWVENISALSIIQSWKQKAALLKQIIINFSIFISSWSFNKAVMFFSWSWGHTEYVMTNIPKYVSLIFVLFSTFHYCWINQNKLQTVNTEGEIQFSLNTIEAWTTKQDKRLAR